MQFSILHTSTYTFDAPVFIEPHVIRLRPREDPTQRIVQYALQIDPQPQFLSESVELEGHVSTHVTFVDLHQQLSVQMSATVETFRDNPFDYYVTDPNVTTLPAHYAPELTYRLKPYLNRFRPSRQVTSMAHDLMRESGEQTSSFLAMLAERTYQHYEQIVRDDGPPMPLDKLMAERRGACRDTATLFVAACRAVGLAARFVSGYAPPDEAGGSYMHAWAEVYLPGGGWRGYDPSNGLAVADRHVAVAAGPDYSYASPVTGTYRGTAGSAMIANVSVTIE